MTDREKLLAKIRALTAKTTGAGCTEAEAMAAAAKAAELMREYGIAEVLLDAGQSSIGVKFAIRSVRGRLCAAVAVVTNCAALHQRTGRDKTLVYVGCGPWPQVACYLHDVAHRAVDAAVKEFRRGGFYRARRTEKTKRKAVEDFTAAFVQRITERLLRLFQETISDDLRAKANDALAALYPRTDTVKHREARTRFASAASAGRGAAEHVNLAHGVAGRGPTALLMAGGGDE